MSNSLGVVVLAAGKGTRMKSKTTKMLHNIAGIPLVAHPIHTALALEPERIVVVVGHQRDEVEEALNNRFTDASLRFVVQAEQLGTAHAVTMAQPELVDGPSQFLLLYGDVPLLTKETLRQLQALHNDTNAVVSFLSFKTEDNEGYGRIVRDSKGNVLAIREHRDCSEEELALTECNAGIYLFDKDFLFQNLGNISTENDQNEFYLTDIVELAAKEERYAQVICVADEHEVMGVNDRSQLALLEDQWLQAKRQELMKSGVTLRAPETIYFHYDVQVGQDTEIESNCSLLGKTTVGNDCHLGAGSYLTNVTISDGTILPPHSIQPKD
ncbi:MAG: bifunctional N-acetylglucosamine-1-phosphate uridyltransferase/glucosamine-1-phosphate acetyltransferase [Deltaproteobacteria bacterium]|nr:MAG: bifunctional N-acetylglucosamine-1-phosphate uridyltransferase/glucosamine-1-phosphate acetyltransferase [Deltaproteobacteria bacterium]